MQILAIKKALLDKCHKQVWMLTNNAIDGFQLGEAGLKLYKGEEWCVWGADFLEEETLQQLLRGLSYMAERDGKRPLKAEREMAERLEKMKPERIKRREVRGHFDKKMKAEKVTGKTPNQPPTIEKAAAMLTKFNGVMLVSREVFAKEFSDVEDPQL